VASGGARRRIDKARLRGVVGKNTMAAARRLAGDGATRKDVENRRNEILRYLRANGVPSAAHYMTEQKAAEIAKAFEVTPDDFLEPVPTPVEREIARLQARLQVLKEKQAAERGQAPRDT
jgi:hypothetical protein